MADDEQTGQIYDVINVRRNAGAINHVYAAFVYPPPLAMFMCSLTKINLSHCTRITRTLDRVHSLTRFRCMWTMGLPTAPAAQAVVWISAFGYAGRDHRAHGAVRVWPVPRLLRGSLGSTSAWHWVRPCMPHHPLPRTGAHRVAHPQRRHTHAHTQCVVVCLLRCVQDVRACLHHARCLPVPCNRVSLREGRKIEKGELGLPTVDTEWISGNEASVAHHPRVSSLHTAFFFLSSASSVGTDRM
jgi:hypothetical protein